MTLSAGTYSTIALMAALAGSLVVADGMWAWQAAWLLGLLSATLLHEAGHAVAAALVGVPVAELRVTLVGGSVLYAGEPAPEQRAAVSIGGPAASALGTLTLLVLPAIEAPAMNYVAGLGGLSALTLIANLVPIGGTDGAEILRAIRSRTF